jgi:phage gp36-like protein
MPYTSQEKIQAAIPASVLTDMLDDDRDGQPDPGLLDQIIATASAQVDGYLAAQYTVPLADPAPALVQQAAYVFACETLYDRRGFNENNPFRTRANAMRDVLREVAAGKIVLSADSNTRKSPGAVIAETLRIDGSTT